MAILQSLNRDGLTILLIEHVMRAVMALASRVLVLDHGVAIAEGHARSRSRAIRRWCNPISARRRSLMLHVENLDVFYGDAAGARWRVARIEEGAIVAIIGANGAGKTTLIRAVAGMQRQARGTRHVLAAPTFPAGRATASATSASVRWPRAGRYFRRCRLRKISMIGAMLPRARAQRREESRTRARACFPKLAERARQPAGTLSGGEQQMLAIGRCLMGAPRLIMFDEPSLGLAPNIVRNVLDTIRELKREGITCLLVEQNVALSLKLASRAYVLENGRVTLSGSGSELLADDRVRSAYMGL